MDCIRFSEPQGASRVCRNSLALVSRKALAAGDGNRSGSKHLAAHGVTAMGLPFHGTNQTGTNEPVNASFFKLEGF